MSKLRKANESFRNGKLEEAKKLYREIYDCDDSISKIAEFNLRLCNKLLMKSNATIREKRSEGSIKGKINTVGSSSNEIRGWVVDLNNANKNVDIEIYIDGNLSNKVTADIFRKDLSILKIDNLEHGFKIKIPTLYKDGKEHNVKVVERKTGAVLDNAKFKIDISTKFSDFEEMLRYTFLDPIINTPFDENKKRCFAFMDVIAKKLAKYSEQSSERPKVSVLMPAYNREDTIAAAIESVLSQCYNNYELLIIDDGSSDKTLGIIKKYLSQYDAVKLIKNEHNIGKSKSINKAIELAEGEWFAYLDSDNLWHPSYLSTMIGAAIQNKKSEALYSGQYLYSGKKDKPYAARLSTFNKNLFLNRNFIDHNSFMNKKSVFDKVGLYNESVRKCLDYDFFVRVFRECTLTSVPVILTDYIYEGAKNTITADVTLSKDVQEVREKAQIALLDPSWASEIVKKNNELRKANIKSMSVIIPSYESLDEIKRCIKAINKLEEREFIEIIVVDNNSSTKVKDYLRQLEKNGVIKLRLLSYNYGFTYAVNLGIDLAGKNNDIILMNNDAEPINGSLMLLSRYSSYLKDSGLLVPAQLLPPETPTINIHVPFANSKNYCDVNLSVHHDNLLKIEVFNNPDFQEIKFAPFFCCYIKREVIDQVGVLDAELGRHYRSDRLYSNLVRKILNKKIYYIPDARVIHGLQVSTKELKKQSGIEFETMFKKNQWTKDKQEKFGYKIRVWDL